MRSREQLQARGGTVRRGPFFRTRWPHADEAGISSPSLPSVLRQFAKAVEVPVAELVK